MRNAIRLMLVATAITASMAVSTPAAQAAPASTSPTTVVADGPDGRDFFRSGRQFRRYPFYFRNRPFSFNRPFYNRSFFYDNEGCVIFLLRGDTESFFLCRYGLI